MWSFIIPLISVAIATTTTAVIMREYNFVSFREFETFDTFRTSFLTTSPDDDEFRVLNNLFLGIADEECLSDLESPAFRGAQRHGGGGVVDVAILPRKEFPYEIEECSRIFFYRIGTLLSDPVDSTNTYTHQELNTWMNDLMRIKGVRLTNQFSFPIALYWHEESADPLQQGELAPGESITISSFLGHVFSANAINGEHYEPESEQYIEKMPKKDGEVVIGREAFENIVDFTALNGASYDFSPMNRLETCEVVPGMVRNFSSDSGEHLTCDSMFLRMVEYSHNVWHDKRLALNYIQPYFVRPVTDIGFENRRLPEKTYEWLKEWYREEQKKIEQDEGAIGPCMNQHVAPTAITHLTPEYKDRLSADLQPILEEWYGKGKLTLTSIYGIRKYNNGSVLRMHVDTVNTHVVSAIINVDQEVDKDWPLLILDHEDKEHKVIMRAGDMCLYESAKLLHGRPDQFVGSHYDNIFIHFKPVDGWDYSWL